MAGVNDDEWWDGVVKAQAAVHEARRKLWELETIRVEALVELARMRRRGDIP